MLTEMQLFSYNYALDEPIFQQSTGVQKDGSRVFKGVYKEHPFHLIFSIEQSALYIKKLSFSLTESLFFLSLLDGLFSEYANINDIRISPQLFSQMGLDRFFMNDRTHPDISILRSAFYQYSVLWTENNTIQPLVIKTTGDVQHPARYNSENSTVYTRYIPSLNYTFSLRRFSIDEHLELFHKWQNQPRVAEYWEMAFSKEKLTEYIEEKIKNPSVAPFIGYHNDTPFCYIESYWAKEDRIAPYYDVDDFDRGFHLLTGNTQFLGRKFTNSWATAVSHYLFLDDPRTQKLVGEPRYDNKALFLSMPKTWQKIKEFDFPHKRAALLFCHRSNFFEQEVI